MENIQKSDEEYILKDIEQVQPYFNTLKYIEK